MITDALCATLETHTRRLFADESTAAEVAATLALRASEYAGQIQATTRSALSAATSFLIAYGDAVTSPGTPPLRTLKRTLDRYIGDVITDVHLLPIFPSTSDGGFSVVDYRKIDPALGDWNDVHALGVGRDTMLDFVANHTSTCSPWFQGWLSGDDRYRDYYLERKDSFDTSSVVRPRTTELFHAFTRPNGAALEAWTTFSADQVDVNVSNPRVLVELTEVLLCYLAHGATTIRLDAIGYLWKRSGTTCIHLPETHTIVKLWRSIIDAVAPGARLLTETNVPHADNIAYLGDGDEAHMVYQFPLPPLVLHTFLTGSSAILNEWLEGLEPLKPGCTWFNFLASHDGIGMRPSLGILNDAERAALVARALEHGGRVSYASGPSGTSQVYELNVSFLDALVPARVAADDAAVAARALAAHAILLALQGVPAIYYHSLFGSSHDLEGMLRSGDNRSINRARLDEASLDAELSVAGRRRTILDGMLTLLRARAASSAFHPHSPQRIIRLDDRLVAIERGSGADRVLVLVNIAGTPVPLPHITGNVILGDSVQLDRGAIDPDSILWIANATVTTPRSPGTGHR
ncbi:alpha-amylase family glycosyl hydrolase [Microbacterium soli]|uniref:Sugar phosphorylase n=1 Tax=Microbacterium soli TaxID=446075 RepID=A0ABP7MJM7_9MICO